MEIITKNKIYFQKQDIKYLQSMESRKPLPESIAYEIFGLVRTLEVTQENKREFLSVEANIDLDEMIAYQFALLYNEVRWQSDEQLKQLLEIAIKEKNKAVKKYNAHYDFDPRYYSYLKYERQIAEQRLINLKEYIAIRNGEIPFELPDNLDIKDIPIYYSPVKESFIKRLFKK